MCCPAVPSLPDTWGCNSTVRDVEPRPLRFGQQEHDQHHADHLDKLEGLSLTIPDRQLPHSPVVVKICLSRETQNQRNYNAGGQSVPY